MENFKIDVTYEDGMIDFCGEDGGCVVYPVKDGSVDELVAAFKRYLETYQVKEEM
jgi:hypothetical protein